MIGAGRVSIPPAVVRSPEWAHLHVKRELDHSRASLSPAALQHHFVRISDGWYYSRYEASGLQSLLAVVEALASTHQSATWWFDSRTAGDIRVRFEVVPVQDMTILGALTHNAARTSTVLGAHVSAAHNARVLTALSGTHTTHELLEQDATHAERHLNTARLAIGLIVVGLAWVDRTTLVASLPFVGVCEWILAV